MSSLAIVAKQLLRQATLQPRLKLPAGRIISLEEGRRLARLIHTEEQNTNNALTNAVEQPTQGSPVVLEENVSKRILLLRQKGNKAANIKAAVAYAQRSKASSAVEKVDAEVRDIAVGLLRKEKGDRVVLRQRRERNRGKKPARKS